MAVQVYGWQHGTNDCLALTVNLPDPIMQAAPIEELLHRRIAYLSGGKDKHGSPLISFPAQASDTSLEDIATCVSYLSSIPSKESRDNGFTVIVDMRSSTWQSIKALFKLLQESVTGDIHAVCIVKPDAFWDKGKSTLSKKEKQQYPFETLMLSAASKLIKFISPNQLTEEFGGTLEYNHEEWIQNRIDFEKFVKDAAVVLQRFDKAGEETLYRQQDERLSNEELLRRQHRLKEIVIDQPSSVLQIGHSLSRRLREDADSGFRKSDTDQGEMTEDAQHMKKETDRLMDKMQEQQSKLRVYLAERDRELGVTMDLGDLEGGMKKVVDWIIGPGEKLLASQKEIGNSYATADQYRREHEKLELKCTDIYGNFAELRHVADTMIRQGHPRADDISAQKNYMSTTCRSFASRLERRRNMLICSVRFHRYAHESFTKMDHIEDFCKVEIATDTVEKAEEALAIILQLIEDLVISTDGAKQEGLGLLDMMAVPIKNTMGKDITPDYTKPRDHVNRLLAEIEGRKFKCNEMAEVKRLKLEQTLQLRTCEKDADQAITWLQELIIVLEVEHISLGNTASEAEQLRAEHSKFEDTAQGSYDYGKQLLQAGLVLRRSLHCDLEPNHERARKLELAWRQFSLSVAERASRLSVSLMFQQNTEKIIIRIDELCLDLAPQLTTSDPAVADRLLRNFTPRKEHLIRDVAETISMGRALLDRLSLPLQSPDRVPKGVTNTIPAELQPQANLISYKLAELEAKKREMEKLWGHPDPMYPSEDSMYPAPMDWSVVTAMRGPMEQSIAPPQYRHGDQIRRHGDPNQTLTPPPRRSREDKRDRSPIRPDSAERSPGRSHQVTSPSMTEADRSPVRRQVAESQMSGRPPSRDFEHWDPTGERDRSNQWDPRDPRQSSGQRSSGGSDQWDPQKRGGRPSSGGSDQFDPRRSSGRPSSGGSDKWDPSKAGHPSSGSPGQWDPSRAGHPSSGSSGQRDPRRHTGHPLSGSSDQWDPQRSGSRPSSGSSDQWDPVNAGHPSSGSSDPHRRGQGPSGRDVNQQSPRPSSRPHSADKQRRAPPSSRGPVEEGVIRPQSSQHQISAPPPYRGGKPLDTNRGGPPSREVSPGDRGHQSPGPQSSERHKTAPSRRPVEQSPIRPQTTQNQMAAPPGRSTGRPSSSKRDDPRDGYYGDQPDGYRGDKARLMRIPTTEDEALGQLQDFERQIDESSEWIRVCVEEMEPRMTDVGANLEEALKLRDIHNELLQKIAAKQQHINGLMTQADFTVSTQQFYNDVYEAMAQSLAEAWRGLNKQLADRGRLLDQSVGFYQSAKEFGEKLDKADITFRDTAFPSDTQTVAKLLQKHNNDKKSILNSSMETMNQGHDLLEHLKGLVTKDAPPADRKACAQSCYGIEKVLEGLQDRRRGLDDLWMQRKARLEQCVSLFDLDQEVNRISDWFTTKGEDYLRRKDVGNSAPETEQLLREHADFEDSARDIQASVDRLLHSAEQVAHSDPASTDKLRSQTRAINTLCDNFMQKLDDRRRLLQATLDFYNNAEMADGYLSQLKVQLTPQKLPQEPKARTQRLTDLSNAISEIADPVVNEGQTLLSHLGPITLGSKGIKKNVDKLEAKSAEMQAQCSPTSQRSSLQYQFDDKYSTLIKWLVNVGDAYLMSNNDMGDQLQTAMDFLQGHERLMEDMQDKNKQVEILIQLTPEVVKSAGPEHGPELQTKADKLKKHWNHIMVCLDTRIKVVLILVKFHKLAKQLTNAMDNMDDQLKSMTQQDSGPLSQSSVLHYQEKWNHLVELHVQLDSTGKNFLSEVAKIRNDSTLDSKNTVITVETMMKAFNERRRYLTDLYLGWNQKATQTKDFKSEWEGFVKYARKVITWVMDTEQAFFPQLAGELGKSLEDAKALQRQLEDFHETAKKVDDKIENCVRTAEVLGLKGDTHGEKERIVDDLMRVHHRFQERLTEYRVLLKMTIAFFEDVKQVNKTMGEAEYDFQHGALPISISEARIKLKQHNDQKDKVLNLYDDAVKEGDGIVIRVRQTDPVSAAKVDLSSTLKNTEAHKDHYLVEWEKQRLRLLGLMDVKQLNLHKQKVVKKLDGAQNDLDGMKGKYGDTLESVTVIIEKFADWTTEKLPPLEDDVKNYVSSAYFCLDHYPKEAPTVRKDMDEVQSKWNNLNKDIATHRDKLGNALEFHKTYKQSIQWQNKGNEFLIAVGRKVPLCTTPDDAHKLGEKIDDFVDNVAPPQYVRLKKLNEMAVDLFSVVPTYVSTLKMDTKKLMNKLDDTNDDLHKLADQLKDAEKKKRDEEEAAKRRKPVIEAPLMASAKAPQEHSLPLFSQPLYIDEPVSKEEQKPVHDQMDLGKLGLPPSEPREVFETMPYFTKVTKDVLVQEGKYAEMECIVKGEPEPDVFWERDGVQVHESEEIQMEFAEDDACTLMFPRATMALGGAYVCKAVNTVGAVACEAKLKVVSASEMARLKAPPGFAPRVLYISPNKKVDEGTPVKLTAQVQATPAPKVVWSKNAIPLDPGAFKFVKEGDKYSVLIDIALPVDSGIYTCSATNSVGKGENSVTLAVQPYKIKPSSQPTVLASPMKAPRFLYAPNDIIVNEGAPAKMTMELEADPHPNVIWTKNGQPVSPGFTKQSKNGNKYSLLISDSLPEDTGYYTCTAVNPAGSAEKTVQLTVRGSEMAPLDEAKFSSGKIALEKARAPSFLEVPEDKTVAEGTPVQLTVEVDAEPMPTILWMKNREPLDPSVAKLHQDGNKYSLVFDKTKPSDAGFYTCVASNPAGKTERATRLSVRPSPIQIEPSFQLPVATSPMQHPKFLQVPDDQIADECTPVSLIMQVQAYPPPTVTWSKDGRPVSPTYTKQLQDGNKYTLVISEALPEDSGNYSCIATNPVGRAKESVQLQVKEARIQPKVEPKVQAPPMKVPVFSKAPQDQIVDEGMPLTLLMQIQAEPPPNVTWAKDGMPINSDFFKMKREGDQYSLFIDEALPEDAGVFTCTATNPAGKTEKSVQVRVRGSRMSPIPDRLVSAGQISLDKMKAPEFLQVPEDQIIDEGSSVTLLVQIQAEPDPKVTWSKDGRPVAKDFYKMHQLGDKYSLSISDVLPEDTGFYTCTASNPAGRAERSIQLKVKGTPSGNSPEFTGKLRDQSIPEGGRLQLECKVKGEPTPDVHWYKDGICIDKHHDYHITRHRDGMCKMELAEVMPEDAGQFMCKAENDNGVAEAKARLRVTDPMLRPCFTTDLDTLTATEGLPCTMHCVATGRPAPNVTWFKDGRVIKSNNDHEILYLDNVATLRFKKTNLFDAGRYQCKAVNPAGEATTSAELIVQEAVKPVPPQIVVSGVPDDKTHKSAIKIDMGKEIRLNAKIAGTPRPEVTWYHNDRRVRETETVKIVTTEESYSLVIPQAKREHGGTYRLVAVNEAGQHTHNFVVDVEQPIIPVTTESIVHSAPPRQPLVVEKLQDIQAVEQFGEIRLQVVIHGEPLPKVTWYLNNNPVYESSRHEILRVGDRHELVVREPVPNDTGLYSCEAVNLHGTVRTECYVTVEEKSSPVILVPLKDVPAHEGDTVKLDVKVSGTPLPQVKWLKDSKTVTETSRVRFTREDNTLGLLIIHIKPTDAGVYKAVIDNNVGKCISTATISVGPPRFMPDFNKPITDVTAIDGERAVFSCEVTGIPSPDVTWYRDGTKLVPDPDFQITRDDNTLTLSIKEVFPDDAGMYSVKATNSEGDCTTVARLHVLGQYSSHSTGSTSATSQVRRSRRTVQTTRQYVQSMQQSSPKYVVSSSEHHTGAIRTVPVHRSSSVDRHVQSHVVRHVKDHRSTSTDRHVTGVIRGGANSNVTGLVRGGANGNGEYVVNLEIQF